ncbi:Zinc protease [Candidatus Hydrogenisulfobacillus filiaventi]|uniref:Zinc protease n=1 Tax=Candidatus Hydrogenisulfobacillus filiaventi TaxID=2707344 RepID=A0A6F8ZKD0_9FIRM|nr:pitrilysin family protein [Bacillota bacterium]CAB1130062.1 Zinc protease [Candidatus Hydrogenisulfobacillus filiaventi]
MTAFAGEMREGRGWLAFPTRKFKTVTVQAVWVVPLTADTAALGALLPQVLRRATARWPDSTSLYAHLESLYGANFRADVGKVGGYQLLSFSLEVVDGQYLPGRPDTLGAALEFLEEVLHRPYAPDGHFDPAVVEQEKALLGRRIQALINDKGQYALQRLVETVADGRPFGLRKLGRAEDLPGITPERLWAFYRTTAEQAAVLVAVVGDVEPGRVEAALDRLGGRGPRNPVAPQAPYTPRLHGRWVEETADVNQGKLNLAYACGRNLAHPGYPALLLYTGILGAFPHSKLFINVRERASLAYYAYARLDPVLGMGLIGAGIETGNRDAARRIIAEQVEAMGEGRFTEEEQRLTVDAYLNEIRSEEDVPGQIIGRQLERWFAGGGPVGEDLAHALQAVDRAAIVDAARQVVFDAGYFLTRPSGGPAGAEEGKA